MRGWDEPGDENGSQERYDERLSQKWEPVRQGWFIHYAWWLLHNAVAHPLIAVAPVKPFFDFHDWTSRKMNRERP